MSQLLEDLRQKYARQGLSETAAEADPMAQFAQWFEAARAAELHQPNAMVVATVTPDGAPSARAIMMAGFDRRGFVFYSYLESRKGQELALNPRAALVFNWTDLERQVRSEGIAERVPGAEADAWFASRPLEQRLGIWASRQDDVVPERQVLEKRLADLLAQYHGREIPRPAYYGGYRVVPTCFEFWQGRPDRLHDRLRYVRQGDGHWRMDRLAP